MGKAEITESISEYKIKKSFKILVKSINYNLHPNIFSTKFFSFLFRFMIILVLSTLHPYNNNYNSYD